MSKATEGMDQYAHRQSAELRAVLAEVHHDRDRLRAALAAAEAERDRMREALVKIDFIPLPVDEADSHSVILNIKYIARAALAKEKR